MPVKEKKTNIIAIWISEHLNWVAAVLAIILLIAGYLLFLKPKLEANKDKPEMSLEQVQLDLANQQARLENLKGLINDYKSLPSIHFEKVEEFLPTENDAPVFFTHLDALAKANDSALLSVAADELGERELIDARVRGGLNLPEDVRVVSVVADFLVPPGLPGYHFFKQLINSLENNLRLMDIEYINFSPDATAININAKVYYLKGNE